MSKANIKQPRPVVIRTKNFQVELKMNHNFSRKWQSRYDEAQEYVDSEVLRRSEPYVPFETGTLRNSGPDNTEIGSGEVVWKTPYARYLYYGRVMVGKKPKTVTNKPLQFHGGGVRGAFWFHRMKEVSGKRIIAGARRIVGKGSK